MKFLGLLIIILEADEEGIMQKDIKSFELYDSSSMLLEVHDLRAGLFI